jgi:drug/metabolite transporter (DMT)-like permease
MRIAVMHFPAFLFIAIRQIIAGILMIAIMKIFFKIVWPSTRELLLQAIAGFFMITLGNGFVAWGEMYISSSIAAIICSLMPMLIILINLSVNNEKPTLGIVVGIAMGLTGIVMIFGQDVQALTNIEYILGILMTFTAVFSWSACSVWLKKKNIKTNIFLNAGLQMLFGGFWLLPLSFLFDDLSNVSWSSEAVYSLLYLILLGSIVAYTCYAYVLEKLSLTVISMYTYINPIVALIVGYLVLDEKINVKIISAILITIGGVYIVNRGYQLKIFFKAKFSNARLKT